MRCTTLLLAALVSYLASVAHPCGAQSASIAPDRIETVSLCELTNSWRRYDHKVVRIDAIYAAGNETSEVYDTGCPGSDRTAWVPDFEKATPASMVATLLRLYGRVRVRAVGEFDGPKKVDIPPNTPPKFADLMRAINSRYGHQNKWDFQFVFSTIEHIEPVAANDPWPHWSGEKTQ